MPGCELIHRKYDAFANGDIQVGELPPSMRIRGQVVWYIYAGPYRDIAERGWGAFMAKVRASKVSPRGPPGDLYVCDPEDHPGDREKSMITILWAPLDEPRTKA